MLKHNKTFVAKAEELQWKYTTVFHDGPLAGVAYIKDKLHCVSIDDDNEEWPPKEYKARKLSKFEIVKCNIHQMLFEIFVGLHSSWHHNGKHKGYRTVSSNRQKFYFKYLTGLFEIPEP